MTWRKRFGIACLVIGLLSLTFTGFSAVAEEANQPGWKDITLEWIYQKDKLGIPPVDPRQPRDLQWSTEGHWLAYLVSYATEAPHLVIYDPAKDATAFLITPSALHEAVIRLASQPEGASIAPAPAPRPIPRDATAIARIDGYEWLKKTDGLRLEVGGKKYAWDRKANRLREDTRPELPGGEMNDLTFSPNERYAAFTRANDLYVYDLEQKKEIRLTHDGGGTILNGRMTWVYWEELHCRR
ncbi:MAG TPA: DPP IV N-terminal domain-containing protein, partial [bacterium]|nr:DPP IV N-terminal domain-containing protein [bacterium]